MSSINDIRQGLDILAKYCDPDKEYVSAEHDQIWAGPSIPCIEDETGETDPVPAPEAPITKEDHEKLDQLGWFIDAVYECYSHFC